MSSNGYVTWCGFASSILQEWLRLGLNKGIVPELTPIGIRDYPTAAPRPGNSRLCNEKLRTTFGISLLHWRDSLNRVMEELAA